MNEETPELIPTEEATPKKRAAKKAAVKKVAKKAARKTAVKDAEPTPVESAPATEEHAPKKRAVRKTAKKAAPAPNQESIDTSPEPTPARHAEPEAANTEAAPLHPAENEAAPRFGRVPGGGPVQARAPREEKQEEPSEDQSAAPQGNDPARDSRSKRRRDKRKRRAEQRNQERQQQGGERTQGERPPQQNDRFQKKPRPNDNGAPQESAIVLSGPKVECGGMLELAPKGFGFLRVQSKNFEQAKDDVFVPPDMVRKNNLRVGQWIHGLCQEGNRGRQLIEITGINGMPAADAAKLPHFEELKAVNPTKRISFETEANRYTTRVVDIMAPIGRGQRGLIVSPPRSGKTTLLLHIAEAIREKYDESIHLMVLLVDERPEEVTEFRRALPGAEIYASSNDEQARNHCRIAELAIERAKRLVEAGKDVFLVMDSITRLARAYNNNMCGGGGGGKFRNRATGSGGIMIGALEVPRRLFAAARNTRGGGSLTILATALIQTNSRADEAIFMEFKGTGNMELVLDRKIAEQYYYPAVDIFKSGTRREELLLPEHSLHKIHLIRRGLSGHRPVEAMERLLYFLKKFPNNPQMLLEIKG